MTGFAAHRRPTAGRTATTDDADSSADDTASVAVDQGDPPPDATEGDSTPVRRGPDPTLADVVVAACTLFLLIANAPGTYRGSPLLLTLVVFPLGAVGVVGLALLARARDTAALWGAGLLGWALISVAFSDQPALAWDGGWGGDRGWVYLAAYLGCWAIGRRRGAAGARLFTGALLVGLFANAFIAFVQAATPNGVGLISLYDGRAMGFTLNPVFLAGLMTGGVALCSAHLARAGRRWAGWLPAIIVLAAAGNMAGGRIGLAGIVLLGVWASWGGRNQWLRTVAAIVAIALGLALGAAALPSSGTARSEGATSSGVANRGVMWNAGAHAIAERPVFGWGPNRFRAATNARVTRDFALREQSDVTFADAHNIVIELGVATGIPGLIALAGFAWAAGRRARGPLAWYAAGVFVSCLVQPTSIATVPTAMLALGLAAASRDPDALPAPPPEPTRLRWAAVGVASVLAIVGLAAAARMVYVDTLLGSSKTSDDQRGLVGRAHRLMPGDPAITDLYARVLSEDAILERDVDLGEQSLAMAERAVELDPAQALLWVDLGVARQRLIDAPGPERYAAAREAYARAQELSPWMRSALGGLYESDLALENPEGAAKWRAKLCLIDACPQR